MSDTQAKLHSILATLHDSLQCAKEALTAPDIEPEIQSLLHTHHDLPDAAVSKKAFGVLDLTYKIGAIVEPSHHVLADYFFGYVNPEYLLAAVESNIADLLERAGPSTIADLAQECQAKPLPLRQVLRLLSSNGGFNYDPTPDIVSNNNTSRLLREHKWGYHWVGLYDKQFYDIARGAPASRRASNPRSAAQAEYDTDMDVYTLFP